MTETEFEILANDAIGMSMISGTNNSSIKATSTFHPDFTYPFVGPEETIRSTDKDLSISLQYASGSLYTYCSYAPLYKELLVDTDNHDDFISNVIKPFKPYGTLYTEYTISDRLYQVFVATASTPNFLPYHKKLQTLTKLFIEGASFCNIVDEPLWQIFTVYEKADEIHNLVGFITAYQFFSYPDHIRYRISQFFILPPHQRQGHGSKLYRTFYSDLIGNPKIAEITDPNDDFQEMRDLCDVQYLLQQKVFDGITAPVPRESLELIRRKCKLNKIRRCCEIILLSRLSSQSESQLTDYRLYVKRRIYLQNQDVLDDMEADERMRKLKETFDAVVEDYQELVAKLVERR